ncbi:ATP-dependent RecD-like DNA helicase [Kurthia zopfii]|uniref:ATP-dependent RecD2 DNA helicase n=1 Tax=Kurthia zopfii TaxID=1650 RepID=A0A2U3AHV5_9BACL|nr:ATP-dependent RecD-like DNA helicase [Kurthia zopfii]PWI24031.1 ATP-dependent RecD-like DNA helicase [Kurthia zopfii]TDR44285.1 exodeoxyribonuclease V alpha subunit [Kurthia zopfii]STX10109.1 Exodeoxyribonuclease V alpha chain [Kurthia zopfii]VEI07849.1 Exodeoxyribonuclease V alpha chain [Kurthia zopfii]GEK29759.1 ATP-dependent RecD-like DNA helicase [Kurthia zopfii]
MTENLSLFADEKLFIVGRPVVSIFHNAENLFSIIKLKIQETNTDYKEKEVIVAGYFPKVVEDSIYRFTGRMTKHPKYGAQFKAETFEKEIPATETGVISYLSSDLFPGIGRRTAEIIVKKLGADAIKIIINNPSSLDDIPRLNEEKKETLRLVLQQNLGMDRIMIKLGEWGFGAQLAIKIYQLYLEDTIQLLQENPYRLIADVDGVGFQRADDLGEILGIGGSHPSRIEAAVIHIVNQASLSDGHTFIEAQQVIPQAKAILEQSQNVVISFEEISEAIIRLGEEGLLCGEETRLYIPSLYYSEVGIASKILQLKEKNEEQSAFPVSEIRKWIGDAEERFEVTYAKTQIKAIETAINSAVMILTGGPGTGKTTVVRGIVDVFAELHGLSLDPKEYSKKDEEFPIILVAPTGRAAKRLSESTGLPAQTIHRLLGFNGQDKEEESEREIEGKLLIVDEMSMVDTWLAHQLLRALNDKCQIVFVGDQDQLPPVGPGQVLKDLLASKAIPTVELSDVYRQADGSSIIELAHQMKMGQTPTNLTEKTSDRSFIPAYANQVPSVVQQVIGSALNKGFSIHDVQVLAPMYRGDAGIDALNKLIQEFVNPKKNAKTKEIQFGETTYRIGDKVLQLVNQPNSNVFNGDMGEIISILKAKETTEKQDVMVISFDGIEVTYERSDLNQITLAYCCSIHKSQGSEFPMVIMPVVSGYSKMLRKNLLYTGLTRAKNFLILCGEPETFLRGIQNDSDILRQTSLSSRLLESSDEIAEKEQPADQEIPEKPATFALTMDNFMQIPPMIGMDRIKPTDFLVDEQQELLDT